MTQLTITPIGIVHTPFKEKFGIPRQSGLVEEAIGTIELIGEYNSPEAIRDIENFGHLWLIFCFNEIPRGKWSPTVRPPRLGGNKRVGVFASRSPFRPNPLGLSLVKLISVFKEGSKNFLEVSGIDLLDKTPIYDIKPYLPDLESIPDSKNSWREGLNHEVENEIQFSQLALSQLDKRTDKEFVIKLIRNLLKQDPRPGHLRDGKNDELKNSFAMKLMDFDLCWEVDEKTIIVTELK